MTSNPVRDELTGATYDWGQHNAVRLDPHAQPAHVFTVHRAGAPATGTPATGPAASRTPATGTPATGTPAAGSTGTAATGAEPSVTRTEGHE